MCWFAATSLGPVLARPGYSSTKETENVSADGVISLWRRREKESMSIDVSLVGPFMSGRVFGSMSCSVRLNGFDGIVNDSEPESGVETFFGTAFKAGRADWASTPSTSGVGRAQAFMVVRPCVRSSAGHCDNKAWLSLSAELTNGGGPFWSACCEHGVSGESNIEAACCSVVEHNAEPWRGCLKGFITDKGRPAAILTK